MNSPLNGYHKRSDINVYKQSESIKNIDQQKRVNKGKIKMITNKKTTNKLVAFLNYST